MQMISRVGRSWCRAVALLVGLGALEAGILRLLGPVPDQVRAVGRLGDPAVEPVSGLLDLMAVATHVVAAYLVVVVSLRMLAWLPGASGRVASGGLRLLTLPAVHRALDGLVGGALLAQVALSPASAHAGTASPWFAPRLVATATATPPAPDAGASGLVGQLPAPTVPGPPWVPLASWPRTAEVPGPTAARGSAAPPTVTPPTVAPGAPAPFPSLETPGPRYGSAVSTTSAAGPAGPGGTVAPGASSGRGAVASGSVLPRDRRHRLDTIRPGDTLWGIAAAHLPAGSRSPAQVARYWQQIYAANRTAIGGDPDMIHPGTRLMIPSFQLVPAGRP